MLEATVGEKQANYTTWIGESMSKQYSMGR